MFVAISVFFFVAHTGTMFWGGALRPTDLGPPRQQTGPSALVLAPSGGARTFQGEGQPPTALRIKKRRSPAASANRRLTRTITKLSPQLEEMGAVTGGRRRRRRAVRRGKGPISDFAHEAAGIANKIGKVLGHLGLGKKRRTRRGGLNAQQINKTRNAIRKLTSMPIF